MGRWLGVVVVAVVLIGSLIGCSRLSRLNDEATPVAKAEPSPGSTITEPTAILVAPVQSPDIVGGPSVEDRPPVRVAFLRERDLFVLDAVTGTETRVTDDQASDAPWWTSDGRTLFFTKFTPDALQTWRWQVGKAAEQVQTGLWSPDGTAVALSRDAEGIKSASAVWVEANGQRSRVTPAEPGVQWQPLAWSPDARRLALARLQTEPASRSEPEMRAPIVAATLWVTEGNLLAAGLRQLSMPLLFGGLAGIPDLATWSPDGRFLVVGSGPADGCGSCRADGLEFRVISVDGGPSVELGAALVDTGAPTWSPDSSFVVLSAPGGRETYRDKHLVRFDPLTGAIAGLAVDSRYADIQPTVSPDGKQIAFARGWAQSDDQPPETVLPDLTPNVASIASRRLWLTTAEGRGPRQILDQSGWTDEAPAWTPDGRWITFVRWHPPRPEWPATAELWAVRPDGSGARRLVADLGNGEADTGFGYYGTFGWQRLFAVTSR
jgi:Tol biopolymer transport system component